MPASRSIAKKKSITKKKPVTNKTGFAVIGLGSIAQSSVLPAFAKCKHARLVAVVGRDAAKTSRLARKFKAGFRYNSDDFATCLANPEVSAVYIATPQGEHARLTIQSAEAGKLGRIDVIHTAFSELYTPGKSLSWLLDAKMAGGGPLMDLGVYCVNTSRWLVDEDPIEANAESWARDRARFHEVEEGISFRLRFPSGLLLYGSSTYSAAPSSFLYVQGSAGWASLSPAFPFEEERKLTAKIGKHHIARAFPLVNEFSPEIDAFASAIQKHGSVEPDGVQGHKDMIILDAIYKSAREKKPVAISY